MSEITATRVIRVATITAATALGLAAAVLLWQTEVPGDLAMPKLDPREEFGAAELDETADYARFLRVDWLLSTLAQLLVLAILAWRAPSIAARLRGGPVVRGVTLLLLALAALWLVRLPFGLAAHWWRRRHGIATQDYLDWLVSPWLELGGTVVAATVAVILAMLLARRLGPRWWLVGGPLLAVLGAAVVLAQPLLLAPKLEQLADPTLAAEIRALARQEGVQGLELEVRNASERTRRANAEVAGLGPTRKLILWDTLLDGRFSDAEVRFVAAHEVAHIAERHLWKGVAWFALLAVPIVLVVATVTRRLGGLAEPAAVPLAVLVAVALQLALLPFANVLSRRYEAEADWVALEATRDPRAAEGLYRGFVDANLAQPEAPAWARALLGTHPPLVDRIAMARAWAGRGATTRAEAPREGS
jgi:STE24 endopeptidase